MKRPITLTALAIWKGFSEYQEGAFPKELTTSVALKSGEAITLRADRLDIPVDTDIPKFLKQQRPHFDVSVYESDGQIVTVLNRIDFRGMTNSFRVGVKNQIVWNQSGAATPTQLLEGMKELVEKLSLKQLGNWNERLARRDR